MRWMKKIFIAFLILLIGLAAAWGIINRKTVMQKAAAVKGGITSIASKMPFIKKLFKKKAAKKEKKQEAAKKEKKPLEVKAFKIPQIHFTDTLPTIGTIKGFKKIELRFEINGTISGFNFREGDLVEKGDIIAELNHTDTQLKVKFRKAKLAAAQAHMDAAKIKTDQYQKLFDAGSIIKSKLEEIKMEYENASQEFNAAKVELESAKLELEKTYLRSPIDGVLETKDTETGEYVTSSIQVASIGEIDEVYAEMGIIEKDLDRINIGQPVTVRVDTYPEEEFQGEIDNIFPTIEGRSRTLTIRARIKNSENKLLPGMFARASITVYEKDNAVVAPPLGLEKTEDGYKAFVIDKDNTVHPRPVDVEYTGNPEYWVIADGLKPDDVIVNEVVSGQLSQLKEGDKTDILETEEYSF